MKKILLFAILLSFAVFPTTETRAQAITIGIQSGYSVGYSAVAGLNVGVNFKYFNIRTGFDANLSDEKKGGMLIQTRIGHTFDAGKMYVSPGIGHAYQYRDADNKKLNKSALLLNCEAGYKLSFNESPIALYVAYTNASNLHIVAVGIRGIF